VRRREFIILITSAATAWPLATRAQPPMAVIGYLSSGSPESDNIPSRLTALRQGLGAMGFVEGENLTIEYRWAQDQYDRLPALAADLVHRPVSVIVPPTLLALADRLIE
jgi:putative ABC transport system substrate-binding protein